MSRLLMLLALLPIAACTGIHTVSPGVYRSPQLHEDLMARVIARHGIQSVLCLRGPGRGTAVTVRAARGTDTAFWNVPMSAVSRPPPATLLALWHAAERAQRPLLLHCRAGVDRTGLASALFVLHDTGDLELARDQLDLIPFGHLSWSQTGAMDAVLDGYAPHHGQLTFPDWVRTVYAREFGAGVPAGGR